MLFVNNQDFFVCFIFEENSTVAVRGISILINYKKILFSFFFN